MASGPHTLTLRDDFNRANGNPGVNWAGYDYLSSTPLQIISNQFGPTSRYVGAVWVGDTFDDDQGVAATIVAHGSSYWGLFVRGTNMDNDSLAQSGMAVFYEAGVLTALELPTYDQIGSTVSHTIAAGSVVQVEAIGDTLTVYDDGVQVAQWTSLPVASGGQVGIADVSQTDTRFDDFQAGSIVSSLPGQNISPTGIASISTVGTPSVATGVVTVVPVGISSTSSVGAPFIPSGGYGGFNSAAGILPDENWRPFSETSPWNTPVTDAPLHPNSAGYVAAILKTADLIYEYEEGTPGDVQDVGNITAGDEPSNDYGHPIYFATEDDPQFTLNSANPSWDTVHGDTVYCPANAEPAGGTDSHMCLVQPDGTMYDLWQVSSISGSTINYSIGQSNDIEGEGYGGGGTAAGFPLLAGIIRGPELTALSINHALFIVIGVGADPDDTSFGYGTVAGELGEDGSSVFPANSGDSRQEQLGALQGSYVWPPMGARLRVNLTESEINALSIPAWHKAMLHALRVYGGYFGDTGGAGFNPYQFESYQSYTAMGLEDPFVAYAEDNLTEVTTWEGVYVFNPNAGVNWAEVLEVVLPPGAVLEDTLDPEGISSVSSVGAPSITTGPVSRDPEGISSTTAVGTPTISTGSVVLDPVGVESTSTVGTPSIEITGEPQTIEAVGVSSTSSVGVPDVFMATPIGLPIVVPNLAATANVVIDYPLTSHVEAEVDESFQTRIAVTVSGGLDAHVDETPERPTAYVERIEGLKAEAG